MQAVTAMETAEKEEALAAERLDRRADPRFGVDEEAHLLLVKSGSSPLCRIVDLSLNGCRIRTWERFRAGSMACVEVSFKVRGFPFRFNGVIQWTDGQHLLGIRFMNVSTRRREELAEVLCEVKAENAAKAARAAAEARAAEEWAAAKQAVEEKAAALRAAEQKAAVLKAAMERAAAPKAAGAEQAVQEAVRPSAVQLPAQAPAAQTPGAARAKPSKRERRGESREAVDTSAIIFLVNVASRLSGRILDLSVGGCRIRTDERFPVGIYTRVETEFRLEGLPFRLGGVIQAIHDRNMVGIRFLDMSSRKREQVEQLMEEIREEQGLGSRE
jgi:c-di-GMP-binding flagellar brake protein YcgR